VARKPVAPPDGALAGTATDLATLVVSGVFLRHR
jgi:hypothetical protein